MCSSSWRISGGPDGGAAGGPGVGAVGADDRLSSVSGLYAYLVARGSGQPALPASEREFLDAYHATAGELPGYPAAQAAATAVLAVHCARQAVRTDRELLWPAVAALDTGTLVGAFKIDQATGAQVSHRTVLIRWAGEEPIAIQTQAEATQPTTLTAG